MCNCKNKTGFKEKLEEIIKLNKETGLVHVVFTVGEFVFCCKESDLKDEFGMCCYFLANGDEVEYQKKSINNIIVKDAKIETSKMVNEKISKKRIKSLPKM